LKRGRETSPLGRRKGNDAKKGEGKALLPSRKGGGKGRPAAFTGEPFTMAFSFWGEKK